MNLDLLSLNLKSKSKYETPRVPIRSNISVEKKMKLYSTPNSAKKSRFVPPLAIPLSDFDEFEEKSDRKSSHVKFLTEQRDYSTPRSIQTFILYNNGDFQYTNSARIIQQAWQRYLRRKKFKRNVTFLLSIIRKKKKFVFHLWVLSMKRPADVSKKSYKKVITYLLNNQFIKEDKNKKLITRDERYYVNNFSQMMGTDFVFMEPQYKPSVVQKFQRSLYQPLLHKMFSGWFSVTLEKIALKKVSRNARALAKKRELFGPMFWTFYFWLRWVRFRKTRKIPSNQNQLFIIEWSSYISCKKYQMKYNLLAAKYHDRYIKAAIVSNLRIISANRSIFNRAFGNVKQSREQKLMMLSLRAFSMEVAIKCFKTNIKRRIIRSWYKVIDDQISSRMKENVFRCRGSLKSLKTSFKKWQNYVIEKGLKRVYLHDLITANNLLMLKIFFLLKGDFPHFAFVAAFIEWKKLMVMNHNKRKFINWSSTKAKKNVTLQSLLNIFAVNAVIRRSHSNFFPFKRKEDNLVNQKSQGELFDLYRNSSSAKSSKRKKLIKAKKLINEKLPVVKVFATSADQTIQAYKNLDDFEICDANWYKDFSSGEVKTLFYRIAILLSRKSTSLNKKFKTPKEKIETLLKFRSDNFLYNTTEINGYKKHQDRHDIKCNSSLKTILKRDLSHFMSIDTHEAAISLHQISNKFAINQIPIKDVTKLKMKGKKSKKRVKITENVDNNEIAKTPKNSPYYKPHHSNRIIKDSNPDHPFLRPIESVKKSIDENNRRYRRKPEDIFDVKEATTIQHNFKQNNKMNSFASTAKITVDTGYEQFTPIGQSLRATRMMSSREFLLRELSDIHDTAMNNIEKIEEGDEYEIYTKDDLKKDEILDEKEELFLPTIEEIPTIYNTPSDKSSLQEMLQATLKKSNPFIKISNSNSNVSDSALVDENDNVETKEDIKFEISIDDLSKNFIDDPGYFEYTDGERAAMLSNKYLKVFEMLIDDSLSKPTPPSQPAEPPSSNTIEMENEEIKTHISSILHKFSSKNNNDNININHTEDKKIEDDSNQPKQSGRQKKPLFEDPDKQFETIIADDGVEYMKSNCPEFSNVAFNGDTVLTNTPWETEIERSNINNDNNSRKLKKKKKKIIHHSSSDSSNENDDSEFNMTSLPKPTFKVPGFDDNVSSPNISNSSKLFDQINSFLSSSYSTVNEQELLIEKLRKEASSPMNNSEQMRRTFMLLIDAVAHKYVLRQLDNNPHQTLISSLVDVDGSSSKEITSEDETSSTISIVKNKFPKGIYNSTRKFAAFDTNSRRVDPPEIIERKFTFTKDLLNAISENAQFASTLKIKYYTDISKLSPFEGMKLLAKKVREKLEFLRNKTKIVKSTSTYNTSQNEVILSIGKKDSNKQPSKKAKPLSRPSTAIKRNYVKKVPKENSNDFVKLEIAPRPRTPLIDGYAKPEPGIKKVVKKPLVTKRKPQFTKMTPTQPVQLFPDFHVDKEYNEEYEFHEEISENEINPKNSLKKSMLTGAPAKLKWNLNSDKINITDEDVDFFLFVTPYVMPPELLNRLIEK